MFQEITVIGNLGSDPELKYTSQGDAVTSFNVATNRKWTGSDGEKVEQTTWFRISVWGNQAEACNEYLSKGRQVFIKGTLQSDGGTGGPRVWVDNEGKSRASFEIRAYTVQFLGSRDTQNNVDTQNRSSVISHDNYDAFDKIMNEEQKPTQPEPQTSPKTDEIPF